VVRIYPLLGNGPINTQSSQQKKVFSVVSVPRAYLEDNRCYSQWSRAFQGRLRRDGAIFELSHLR
jgi:hypothetical protein